VSTAELTTAGRPWLWWRLHRQGDAVGASLVSPGSRLLVVITNKMSMLSSSHSTQTLTILSFRSLALSSAIDLVAFALVTENWWVLCNPIMRRVMVARQTIMMLDTRSSVTKMGRILSQELRGVTLHCLSWKSINSSYNEPSTNLSASTRSRRKIETAPVRLHCLTVTDFPNNLI
jgi:hypothetical protein